MMNFSDETVEKVAKVLHAKQYYGGWEHLEREFKKELKAEAKAALSSLTLADLMQVDAVRELVPQWQPIETAPKPVVEIVHVGLRNSTGNYEVIPLIGNVANFKSIVKLTYINGVWDKEKSEQVK